MFKKITVVTALSTALLFGGSLSSVDASANTDHSQDQFYKVLYSVNGGEFQNLSQDNADSLLNKYHKNYQINCNWNKADQKQEKQKQQPTEVKNPEQNKVQQPEQTQEQPKQEQPKQEQANQAQPKQPEKTQAPAQQQTADKQQQQTPAKSQQLNQFEQQVVELTNNERAKQGLSPLKIDVELSKVAREKSRDMQANGYFAHNSPTYGSPFDMMKSFGISYNSAGENIARGQRTPEEVVNAWMNSEGHRANILNPSFTHIGVGYVADGNYWTQQFIGK